MSLADFNACVSTDDGHCDGGISISFAANAA